MARNWVGIDVAKAELVVAVAPHGEVFTVANTADGVTALVERLRKLKPQRIVLEATGGYETLAATALATRQLPRWRW